jgi:hypothetical protein
MHFEDAVSRKTTMSEELPMPQERVYTAVIQRLRHLEK